MFKKKKRVKQKNIFLWTSLDMNLIFCILFLNIIGLVMVYSASYYYAEAKLGYSQNHFFVRQSFYAAAGIAAMLVVSMIRLKWYVKLQWLIFPLAIFFLISVKIPGLQYSSHGATRWISIGGLTLQVAEPIKILLILFYGWIISAFDIRKPLVAFISIGIALFFAFGLYKFSNNMSTAMIVLGIVYLMLMLNTPKQKLYWLGIFAGVILLIILVYVIDHYIPDTTEEFRYLRVKAWLHPNDPQFARGEAYQGTLALYAIGSGGFFGKGFGRSLMKFTLPEPHNDYILAIIFEELGILGVLIILYLFCYMLYRIFRVYLECRERFSKAVVMGVFIHFSLQIVLNFFVALGLLPTMGVTLPFISAGGAAAVFSLIELGLVLAADKQNKENALFSEVRQELAEEDPDFAKVREYQLAQNEKRKEQKKQKRIELARKSAQKKRERKLRKQARKAAGKGNV